MNASNIGSTNLTLFTSHERCTISLETKDGQQSLVVGTSRREHKHTNWSWMWRLSKRTQTEARCCERNATDVIILWAANVISRTSQADGPDEPRKTDPIADCSTQDHGKELRKKREIQRSLFRTRSVPFHLVGLVIIIQYELWSQNFMFCANMALASTVYRRRK